MLCSVDIYVHLLNFLDSSARLVGSSLVKRTLRNASHNATFLEGYNNN